MDYINEADLTANVTSIVDKCLNGVAGSRVANHIVLNPDVITLDFNVLLTGGENAVSTQKLETPSQVTEVTNDEPGTVTENGTKNNGGRTRTGTSTPPTRTTVTGRSGRDNSDTDRSYEEFED